MNVSHSIKNSSPCQPPTKFLSLITHTHTLSLFLSHTHSPPPPPTHTDTHSLSLSLSLSLTHILSLSLSHTHTHTHTCTCVHTQTHAHVHTHQALELVQHTEGNISTRLHFQRLTRPQLTWQAAWRWGVSPHLTVGWASTGRSCQSPCWAYSAPANRPTQVFSFLNNQCRIAFPLRYYSYPQS